MSLGDVIAVVDLSVIVDGVVGIEDYHYDNLHRARFAGAYQRWFVY